MVLIKMEDAARKLFAESISGRDLVLDDGEIWNCVAIEEDNFGDVYKNVIKIASEKKRQDQPFGDDEFPDMEYFSEYAGSGFVVGFENGGNVSGYGFITPSHYSRLPRPIYADLRVVTLSSRPSINQLSTLLKALQEIASHIGYIGLIVDTFTANLKAVEAATLNGFRNALIVPLSASLAGLGLSDSIVLFKPLEHDYRKFPDPDSPSIEHLPEYRDRPMIGKKPKRISPFHTFLPNDTKLTIRSLEPEHVTGVVEMFRQASERGQGFGTGEIPPEEVIQAVIECTYPGQAVALELAESNQLIGVMYVGPSLFCRSSAPVHADCYAIVDEKFGSKGVGSFISSLLLRLAHEIGYTGCLSDSFLCNIPVIKIIRIQRYIILGTLWKGGHLKGQGYSDMVFFYRETYKDDPQQCKLTHASRL